MVQSLSFRKVKRLFFCSELFKIYFLLVEFRNFALFCRIYRTIRFNSICKRHGFKLIQTIILLIKRNLITHLTCAPFHFCILYAADTLNWRLMELTKIWIVRMNGICIALRTLAYSSNESLCSFIISCIQRHRTWSLTAVLSAINSRYISQYKWSTVRCAEPKQSVCVLSTLSVFINHYKPKHIAIKPVTIDWCTIYTNESTSKVLTQDFSYIWTIIICIITAKCSSIHSYVHNWIKMQWKTVKTCSLLCMLLWKESNALDFSIW